MNFKTTFMVNNEFPYESISEIFHENTKLKKSLLDKNSYSIVDRNKKIDRIISGSFKSYQNVPSIKLSSRTHLKYSLENVLLKRRSIREFSNYNLSFSSLSKLLTFSSGVSSKRKINRYSTHYFRTYPSAGALYPLEIYPLIFKVKGVKPGLYHFNVKENSIETLKIGDFRESITSMILYPEIVTNCNLLLFITGIFSRMKGKYGERGYRFVLLEAGHLAQNIYLTTTALGLGCVALGGFLDDELERFINIDGVNESVIYTMIIGKPKSKN